jgi:ATP-binding cassette subfamily F protein uup
VTHDRYLLDRLSTSLLALDGNGGVKAYVDLAQWEQGQKPLKAIKAAPVKAIVVSKPASRPVNKRLTWNEQQEWKRIEKDIASAEAKVAEYESSLSDPAVVADHRKMHVLCDELAVVRSRVDSLYARWQELEEKQA